MFSQVCVHRGSLPQCMLGDPIPPARETLPPGRSLTPCQGDPPAKETPCQGDPPPGRSSWQGDPLPGRPSTRETPQGDPLARRPPTRETPQGDPLARRPPSSRPTPRGRKLRGDQVQAHSQGWNWGGSDPGPHPRRKLRGIRSRPTPKRGNWGGSDPSPHLRGEIEGDQIQAHTQGGNWGGSGPDPRPNNYCCGRYASYWNAFLLFCNSTFVKFCRELLMKDLRTY